MNKNLSRTLLPLLAALVLAGCATAPASLPEPLGALPATFKDGGVQWTRTPAEPAAPAAWWTAFNDPALDALVERAAAANTSVQGAAARLAQARALLSAADAERLPQLGASASVTREAQPALGVPPRSVGAVGASLSYELDLVGRLSGASRAAALDARQREALLRSTQLLVQSQVAQAYFALRALDAERTLVRDTVAAYRDTQNLIERRVRAGDVAELDLARVRSEVAATEAEALALERQRTQVEHALALLVGAPASAFALPAADWSAALPQVPAGVPSTVLARRPDIAAAQDGLRAAQARLGVAQAAWFPSLSLTAAGGVASTELSDLFRHAARAWSVGALLALPIFDGGRREAGVASAQAGLDGALAAYREQLLVAFKDVEDELAALRLLDAQGRAQAQAVEAAARATALSDVRYRNGLVSQLELLDARRSELRNRRQSLQVKAAQYQSTVGLIKALGGGWG